MNGSFCEANSEHVKQNRPKLLLKKCFVSGTKHFFNRSFLHFCFTCSPGRSQALEKGKNDAKVGQFRRFWLLILALFSDCMNVYVGYRSLIEIFAMSKAEVVKQKKSFIINVHCASLGVKK